MYAICYYVNKIMKIKNFKDLAVSESRKITLEIAEAGLEAIDTRRVIKESVRFYNDKLSVKDKLIDLERVKRIFLVGVGKCAGDAAVTLERILGGRLTGGIILDIKETPEVRKLKVFKGTHPLPSLENRKATVEIIDLLKGLTEDDFVIFVISGGGSTLLSASYDLSEKEEASIVNHLLKSGATIQEINTVRKHISYARGGFLAKYAYPASSVALIFSDVPSNDIQFIASGPTVKDATTIEEAEAILVKYDVIKKCTVENCGLIETPKEDIYFEKVTNLIVVSNENALGAMAIQARRLGFGVYICTACLAGEAREAGEKAVKDLANHPAGTVLLYGGETTVTVRGDGKGGRNQEFVLSALLNVKPNCTITSIASDGWDNTEFAGAICDEITKRKADEMGLNPLFYLKNNNSYEFFKKTGDFILTGNTGSNVSDLVIALSL